MRSRTIALAISAATLFYILFLGYIGFVLIRAGGVGPVGLGIGVVLLVPLGLWVLGSTLRAGMRHQHLARRLHEEDLLPDTSDLPRRPSGRIDREAADAWFEQRRVEYEADPDNWRTVYRLAIGYDTAGDRSRARETMKRAVALEAVEAAKP